MTKTILYGTHILDFKKSRTKPLDELDGELTVEEAVEKFIAKNPESNSYYENFTVEYIVVIIEEFPHADRKSLHDRLYKPDYLNG